MTLYLISIHSANHSTMYSTLLRLQISISNIIVFFFKDFVESSQKVLRVGDGSTN